MNDSASGYTAVIQAAIDREKGILGDEEAIERAETVEGLRLEEGTVVGIERDGKEILRDLVDTYVEATGNVAAFVIARRIENLPAGDVDLPENLARHM